MFCMPHRRMRSQRRQNGCCFGQTACFACHPAIRDPTWHVKAQQDDSYYCILRLMQLMLLHQAASVHYMCSAYLGLLLMAANENGPVLGELLPGCNSILFARRLGSSPFSRTSGTLVSLQCVNQHAYQSRPGITYMDRLTDCRS